MKTNLPMKENTLSKSLSIPFSDGLLYEDHVISEVILPEGSKIAQVEFSGCTFLNCKFFKTIFFDCRFENCTFQNCDLSSLSIKHTVFNEVLFVESKLMGIQWPDAGIPLDVHFRNCFLNYSSFIGVNLKNAQLTHCQLKEVDFTETNLSKANCRFSDFAGARFINTNLEYTDLSHASNYAIHPDGNKLRKTIFSLPEAMTLLNVYDIIIK
jgi:fluoroquinolone resistance protein